MRLLITLGLSALYAAAAPVPIRSGCDAGDSVIATVAETASMRVTSALVGDAVCYSITVNVAGRELSGYTVDPKLPAVVEFENERREAFRKASIVRPNPNPPPTPTTAAPAGPPVRFPNFEAVDLQGRRVNLSSLRGKVLIVSFWTPSSPKTLTKVTGLRGLYSEFHSQGLDAVGVAMGARKSMASALDDVELDWPQVNDEAGLARSLEVPKEGKTFVLDANRNIIASNVNGPELTSLVMKLLHDSKAR